MRWLALAPLSRYPLDRLSEASVHRQESFPKGPGRFATSPPTGPPQPLPPRARFRLSAGRRRWRAESREAMLPRHAGLTRSFSGPHTRAGSGGGAAELQGVRATRSGLRPVGRVASSPPPAARPRHSWASRTGWPPTSARWPVRAQTWPALCSHKAALTSGCSGRAWPRRTVRNTAPAPLSR
jgi:hypothetical protein